MKSFRKVLLVVGLCVGAFADSGHGTLSLVTDGDTLHFRVKNKDIKCKVAYIQTPESRRNLKARASANDCKAVTLDRVVSAGKASTKFVRDNTSIGKVYRIETKGKDKLGNEQCVIHLSLSETLNQKMVKEGYAVVDEDSISSSSRRNNYKLMMADARMKKKGLWNNYPLVMNCIAD